MPRVNRHSLVDFLCEVNDFPFQDLSSSFHIDELLLRFWPSVNEGKTHTPHAFHISCLMCGPASVDQKDMARDKIGSLRGQIDQTSYDILRLADPA